MFLVHLVSRLMSLVARALLATWTHGLVSVCVAPGVDQSGVDDGLVEVLVVVRHPRRMSWTMLGRIFDEKGQRNMNVELLGFSQLHRHINQPEGAP